MSGTEIPWLHPLRAAIAGEAGRPTVLALATVDAAGDPQVRCMVCRRVDELGQLWMTSDSRGAKHEQILRHPRAAAVAWFPSSRQQFRFSGPVKILDRSSPGHYYLELWQSLSPEVRATFFWPAPGQLRSVPDEVFAKSSESAQPPESFHVLVMTPIIVDCLSLALHPHGRTRWKHDAAWTDTQHNP